MYGFCCTRRFDDELKSLAFSKTELDIVLSKVLQIYLTQRLVKKSTRFGGSLSVPHSYRQKAEYTTLYSFMKRILATGSVVATSFEDIMRENPHRALVDECERIESMFTEVNEDEVEKIIAAFPSAFFASEKKDLLLLAKRKRGFVPFENLRMNRFKADCAFDVTVDQLDSILTVVLGQMARLGLIPNEVKRPGGMPAGGWRPCLVGARP